MMAKLVQNSNKASFQICDINLPLYEYEISTSSPY